MPVEVDRTTLERNWPAVPYPGIRPFQISESGDESLVFFGRRSRSLEVLDRLYESPFLALVGPSGCGKSSLIKVGVIPKLNAGKIMRAGTCWITTGMEPGRDPIGALERAWRKAVDLGLEGGFSIPSPAEGAFRNRLDTLAVLDEKLAQQTNAAPNILLLVDQFEELFRRDLNTPERAAQFVNLLLNAYHAQAGRLYIILTMRTDSLEGCANFKGLLEVLNRAQYLVAGLDEGEVLEAITKPASLRRYGGTVDPKLVSALLDELTAGATYNPDHLPLMQHALQLMWRRATKRAVDGPPVLDLDLYKELQDEKVPGLAGLLSKHANHLLKPLPRDSASALFRLTSRQGDGGKPSRRATSIEEAVAVGGAESSGAQEVLDVFSAEEACFLRLKD